MTAANDGECLPKTNHTKLIRKITLKNTYWYLLVSRYLPSPPPPKNFSFAVRGFDIPRNKHGMVVDGRFLLNRSYMRLHISSEGTQRSLRRYSGRLRDCAGIFRRLNILPSNGNILRHQAKSKKFPRTKMDQVRE